MNSETILAPTLSNREFLETYAQPGRIGLVGGETAIEKVIRRAERHVDEAKRWSRWSHVFVFGERRCDGHFWLIESDIHLARKHIRLGAQENRISKYFDESIFTSLAVLDFGLPTGQVNALLSEGLELVAGRIRYSLRELMGALIALRKPALRSRENVLARDQSFYCSAFVQHLFAKIGIDLVPGVRDKNSTPEDIARTPVPHMTYLLERHPPAKRISRLNERWQRHRANRQRIRASRTAPNSPEKAYKRWKRL